MWKVMIAGVTFIWNSNWHVAMVYWVLTFLSIKKKQRKSALFLEKACVLGTQTVLHNIYSNLHIKVFRGLDKNES